MEESSTYQLIIERGEASSGTGKIRRAGHRDALAERLTDVDRLQTLTDRILDVTTWQALLS